MRLYRVTCDGQDDYIEAESFGDAVAIWRAHNRSQDDSPGESDEVKDAFWNDAEPEQVVLANELPVLRRAVPA